MADVELQAVVSVDIEQSKKNIERDLKKLNKEVDGLLKDIQLKIGLDPKALQAQTQQAINASQAIANKNPVKQKAEVDIDLTAERAKFNQIQKLARDTGVQIDQELKSKLELDVAQATLVLKQIRKEIKDTTDKDTLIRLNIEAGNIQSQLTEFKKGIRDLTNTGQLGLSRLAVLFDGVKGSIGGAVGALGGLAGSALGIAGLSVSLDGLADGFNNAVQTALSFERAFTGVRKTFQGTAEEFDILKNSIIGLSQTTIPLPVEELAKIAELGSQLGVASTDLLKFTDVVARIGVSTNVSTEEAATSLARLSNVFQLPIDDVDKLASSLVDLGNNFATTENDIIQFTRFLGPAGKQAGLSAQDILGIGTALSSVGINAEAGGSAISKALNVINVAVATGSPNVAKFAQVAGQSADDFAAKRQANPAAAFTDFVEGLGKSGNQATLVIDELIGTDTRLRNALLASAGAGDILRDSLTKSNQAYIENTALVKESANFFGDAKADADRYTNTIRNQTAEIGTKLLPVYNLLQQALIGILGVFNTLAGTTASVVQFFTSGSTAAKLLTGALTSLAAIIAIASFGPIVASIGAFVAAIPAFIAGSAILTTAFTVLGGAITFATSGLGLLVIAGGALTAYFGGATGAISGFVNGLFGINSAIAATIPTVEELGKQYQDNTEKINELTKAGGDNKKQIDELKKANEEIATQLGITGDSVGSLTQQYFDNERELANLSKQLANGTITQELYNEKAKELENQQLFLKNALGETSIAQERLRQAQIAYTKASLDTTVSQEQLEALRQKAIQASEAVVQALRLQNNAEIASAGPRAFDSSKLFDLTDTQKQLKTAEDGLKRLRENAAKPIPIKQAAPTSKGGSSRGAKDTSEADALKEAQKQEEELTKKKVEEQKKRDALTEKQKKLLEDITKFTSDQAKKSFDEVSKKIDESTKKIEDFDKKIKDLQSQSLAIDTGAETDLATRAIAIQKELENENLKTEEKIALEKELALATANTTQEQLDRAKLLSEETATERILREREERKAEIDRQIQEQQDLKTQELAIQTDLIAQKQAIQDDYLSKYKIGITDAYDTELLKIAEVKKQLQDLNTLRNEIGIASGATSRQSAGVTGTTTNNIQPTINVNATINNDADLDSLARELTKQITNGAKGIL